MGFRVSLDIFGEISLVHFRNRNQFLRLSSTQPITTPNEPSRLLTERMGKLYTKHEHLIRQLKIVCELRGPGCEVTIKSSLHYGM